MKNQRLRPLTPLSKPSPLNEFLVKSQHQAMTSNLLFYDIFAPTKNSSFEVTDDVIACDLWFGPPNQKSWLHLLVSLVIVTVRLPSDVSNQVKIYFRGFGSAIT